MASHPSARHPRGVSSPRCCVQAIRRSTPSDYRRASACSSNARSIAGERLHSDTGGVEWPSARWRHQPGAACGFRGLTNVGDPGLGSPYADGHLLGVAAFLPRALAGTDRVAVLKAMGGVHELRLGRMGIWVIERISPDANLYGLRQQTWTRPSRRWASATPVILDRFPGDPYGADSAEIVASSCERIGLPKPVDVKVSRFSPLIGVPPSNAFTPQCKSRYAAPVPCACRVGFCRSRGWSDSDWGGTLSRLWALQAISGRVRLIAQ